MSVEQLTKIRRNKTQAPSYTIMDIAREMCLTPSAPKKTTIENIRVASQAKTAKYVRGQLKKYPQFVEIDGEAVRAKRR